MHFGDGSSRNPRDDGSRSDVGSHDCTGADDRFVANSYAHEYDSIGADEDAVTDDDGLTLHLGELTARNAPANR